MSLQPLETLGSQANFFNLSLLICNLFASGKFRLINILYHPLAIDNLLLFSLDSVCPFQIPINTHDISANETVLIDRRNQRTDSILQLIFLPPDQLNAQFNRIENLLTFYRVFIFETSHQLDLKQINAVATRNSSSSSLLLIYNSSNGALSEFILTKSSIQSAKLSNGQSNANEIFNSVFGDKAAGRLLVVCIFIDVTCKAIKNLHIAIKDTKVFGSIYFKELKASFIDGIVWNCENVSVHHRRVRPARRSFYSDFNSEFELYPDAQK